MNIPFFKFKQAGLVQVCVWFWSLKELHYMPEIKLQMSGGWSNTLKSRTSPPNFLLKSFKKRCPRKPHFLLGGVNSPCSLQPQDHNSSKHSQDHCFRTRHMPSHWVFQLPPHVPVKICLVSLLRWRALSRQDLLLPTWLENPPGLSTDMLWTHRYELTSFHPHTV